MKTLFSTLAVLVFSFVLVAYPSRAATPVANWDAFVTNFIEAYLTSHPAFAVRAGRHEFDGQLPHWSPSAFKTEIEWLKSERRRAQNFKTATLDERQLFERDYLINVIDSRLFWIESARLPDKNPLFYSRAPDPNVYVTREYAPLIERLQAYIRYAKQIPRAAAQIRQNLNTPLPHTYVELGKILFGGLTTYYKNAVPPIFLPLEDPKLQTEFRIANARAIKAMQKLTGWFEAQRRHATDDFALGPDLFSKMLWETERVKVPLDRLEKLGRADLERNRAALRKACQSYTPGKPISTCIDKLQSAKPKGGPVVAARRQLPDLKSFLLKKQQVKIPGTEEAHVAESPPYKRWNPAYIEIPGPFEKQLPSVYHVAPPDPGWSPEERKAYIPGKAYLLFISIHEVWPGHFLQYLHAH